MNCARRLAARQSRLLAAHGWQVLQIDLGGCGDSSGELVEASVVQWRQDLRDAMAWLEERHDSGPIVLWGLRLGALLAVDLSRSLPGVSRLVLWQPVTDGARFLTQFLRMALATDFEQAGARPEIAGLRQQLAQRGTLEIAGYTLSAALAREIEQLQMPATLTTPVAWLQLGSGATLAAGSAVIVERWRAAGTPVLAECVAAPPFWNAPGYDQADALMATTLRAAERASPWK